MTALLEYIDPFIKNCLNYPSWLFQNKFNLKPERPMPFRPYPFLWPCIVREYNNTAGGDNIFSMCSTMSTSLLTCFKSARSKDGLPNPRGSLSAVVPPRAISQAANQEVQKTLADQSASKQIKKHGNMVTAYTGFHLVCCHFRLLYTCL